MLPTGTSTQESGSPEMTVEHARPTARIEISARPPHAPSRTILRHSGLVFGVVTVSLALLIALFPGFATPQDPLGRDILSRLLYGSRVSLTVGFWSVLIGGPVGLLLGLVAGYRGGMVDILVMRLVDLHLAFPFVLLAMAMIAILGPGLWN